MIIKNNLRSIQFIFNDSWLVQGKACELRDMKGRSTEIADGWRTLNELTGGSGKSGKHWKPCLGAWHFADLVL